MLQIWSSSWFCFSGKLFTKQQKILDGSKLKAFADNKMNMIEKLKWVLGRVENIVGKGENAGNQHFLIVGKGENAGNQHFLLFPQCFLKFSYTGLLKLMIVW